MSKRSTTRRVTPEPRFPAPNPLTAACDVCPGYHPNRPAAIEVLGYGVCFSPCTAGPCDHGLMTNSSLAMTLQDFPPPPLKKPNDPITPANRPPTLRSGRITSPGVLPSSWVSHIGGNGSQDAQRVQGSGQDHNGGTRPEISQKLTVSRKGTGKIMGSRCNHTSRDLPN